MLALSVQQPWAHLIVHGFKRIENRDWRVPPTYRGWVLIHAGLKPDRTFPRAWAEQLCGETLPAFYPQGGIVGIARLVAVVTESIDPWFVGPLGFVFEDAKPLPFTALRGQLGLFAVDDALLQCERHIVLPTEEPPHA
jgi:hypothetical protein